ncbi:MAG: preprotein translocase subunit SecG [candidate division Zixibacteria bacterium]|nr:preprotein translocase subunit SecG [candidate division Zixibacteria bacterium]
MVTALSIIHILVCIGLIGVVLMQAGKGGGLSSAFGGMAASGLANTMFGGRGATTLLTKVTIFVAGAFMILVIGLNFFQGSAQGPRSLIREEALKTQQKSPAQGLPAAQPAPQQPAPVPIAPAGQTPAQTPAPQTP